MPKNRQHEWGIDMDEERNHLVVIVEDETVSPCDDRGCERP